MEEAIATCGKYGIVDHEVGGSYNVRPTMVKPLHVYAIDVSAYDPHRLRSCLDSIKSVAMELQRQYQRYKSFKGTTRSDDDGLIPCVGLFLYDTQLYFPYLKQKNDKDEEEEEEVCMAVMRDVEDEPFLPLPLHLWCLDVCSGTDILLKVMDAIPNLVKTLTEASSGRSSDTTDEGEELSCGGAALAVIGDALADTGGRGTLMTTQRPNYGVGRLRHRASPTQYLRSRLEQKLYTPIQCRQDKELAYSNDIDAANFYRDMGMNCVKNRVCVDVVLLGDDGHYWDIATIGELCRITNGRIKWIRGCVGGGGEEQLEQELLRSATRPMGNDCVFKLRCSEGVRVQDFVGNVPGVICDSDGLADAPELEIPSVGVDTTIAIGIQHKVGGIPDHGGNTNRGMVFFQSALLYTSPFGERRVRVMTLGLRTTKHVQDVFRGADYGAMTSFITRQAIFNTKPEDDEPGCGDGLAHARDRVVKICVNILTNYRLHTSASKSPAGQLILPESLQLLPIFCLSLRKSVCLRPSTLKKGNNASNFGKPTAPSPSADERAYQMFYANGVSPSLGTLLVHPNLFCLTGMNSEDGYPCTPIAAGQQKKQSHEHGAANPFTNTQQQQRGVGNTSSLDNAACQPYIRLPRTTHPSMSCLADDEVYILDDGFALYFYVGKSVSEEVRMELFGEGSMQLSQTQPPTISKSSDYGQRILNIIAQMRDYSPSRPTFAPTVIVLAKARSVSAPDQQLNSNDKENGEEKLRGLLVDDPTVHEKGYVDFLCSLHKQIRSEVQEAMRDY